MKKAVIDYNFHNYQQSFKERMKPIVESAKTFLKELVEEEGGICTPETPICLDNGEIIKSVFISEGKLYFEYEDSPVPLEVTDLTEYDDIIIQVAQYLYEN